jgi:hypothetical protein
MPSHCTRKDFDSSRRRPPQTMAAMTLPMGDLIRHTPSSVAVAASSITSATSCLRFHARR